MTHKNVLQLTGSDGVLDGVLDRGVADPDNGLLDRLSSQLVVDCSLHSSVNLNFAYYYYSMKIIIRKRYTTTHPNITKLKWDW